MTLAEQLHRRLSDWRPDAPGRQTLTAPADGWTATVSADRTDTVGCLAWEMTLDRTAPAPDGLTLKGWADGTAKRVSGLLERLTVVEVDETHDAATLRSDVPTARGETAGFYEVTLHGTTRASLTRWQADKSAGGKRSRVPFAVTHEALAKVAGDIAG
jgi:hypothetical protein